MTLPTWLPPLLLRDEYNEEWEPYVERVYAVFENDFYRTRILFRGGRVIAHREPMDKGKAAAFWHAISEGKKEEDRLPDPRRCERIGWIRGLIENSTAPEARVWIAKRETDLRTVIALEDFSYVVVLGNRTGRDNRPYYKFITAYAVEREHRRKLLRKEWQTGKI